MERCLLALGGNQNIGPDTFLRAADSLAAEGVRIHKLASVFRTKAVGENAGADFLNSAAIAVTELTPPAILRALHRVEESFDRIRTIHWGPRTLDLDLLMCGSFVCDTAELVVPHPSMWYRRFVLDPLVEIAADEIHPVFGESVCSLWQRLQTRPLLLEIQPGAITGGNSGNRQFAERLTDRLNIEFSSEAVSFQLAESSDQIGIGTFGQLRLTSPNESQASPPLVRWQPMLSSQRTIQVVARDDFGAVTGEIRQIVSSMTG